LRRSGIVKSSAAAPSAPPRIVAKPNKLGDPDHVRCCPGGKTRRLWSLKSVLRRALGVIDHEHIEGTLVCSSFNPGYSWNDLNNEGPPGSAGGTCTVGPTYRSWRRDQWPAAERRMRRV